MKNEVVRKYNILVDVIYCFVKEAHALDGFMCGSLKGDVVIVFCLAFRKTFKVFHPKLLVKLSCPELRREVFAVVKCKGSGQKIWDRCK